MKTVPLRLTFKTDFVGPVVSFCRPFLTPPILEELQSYLCKFQESRDTCVRLLNGDLCTPHELFDLQASFDTWTSILFFLDSVIPFSHEDLSHIPFAFTWTDPLASMKKDSSHLFLFEKLSAVYNLGACYCNLGLSLQQEKVQERKKVLNLFQKAASVFSYLKKTIEELKSNTVWFSMFEKMYWASAMFEALAYAQAQISVYDKAVSDHLCRSLLSKLAFQASKYLASASESAQHLPMVPLALDQWLKCQQIALTAASHYQRAQADLIQIRQRSEGYGMVIVRLQLAEACCQQAQTIVDETTDLVIDISNLYTSCSNLLADLRHDNATVYLEVIPPADSLSSLEGVIAVKPQEFQVTPLQQLLPHGHLIEAFFIKTIHPSTVNEIAPSLNSRDYALDVYGHGRLLPMLRVFKTRLGSLQDSVTAFYCVDNPFAYMTSEKDQDVEAIFDKIWEKLEWIKLNGGLSEIEKRIQHLSKESLHCDSLLSSLEHQMTSHQELHGGDVLQLSVSRYRSKLEEAISANTTLEERFRHVSQNKFHEDSKEKLAEKLWKKVDRDSPHVKDLECHILSPCKALRKNLQNLEDFITTLTSALHPGGKYYRKLCHGAFRQCALKPLQHEIVEDFQKELKQAYTQMQSYQASLEDIQAWWTSNSQVQNDQVALKQARYLQSLDEFTRNTEKLLIDTNDGLTFFTHLSLYLDQLEKKVVAAERMRQMRNLGRDSLDDLDYLPRNDHSHQDVYDTSSHLSMLPLSQQTRKSLMQSTRGKTQYHESPSYPNYPQL